ncbi:glycosyltransferase [Mangrovivirga sp. M17]|uniref:Glycosyltransferase n=1 Tax=Mangrovivirga halotolerans TaxID=2993936 RepID=A0ABT3RMC3_9BACT|nr:glycosyltransferase [Mangrovivirga halotolerans]
MAEVIIILVFFISSVTLIWFYLYYFEAVTIKNPNRSDLSLPPLSIVVAAHNEKENLKKLIPSVLGQNYPEFELIIVNDRSRDQTNLILEKYSNDKRICIVNIDTTPSGRDSKKNAILQGINKAKYEHLIFTDADCRPVSDNWLNSYGEIYSCTPKTQVILGYSPHFPTSGLLGRFIEFETATTLLVYMGKAIKGKPYMAVGRNMSYTKSFFKQSGGFSSFINVTGGDDDIIINRYAKKDFTKVNTSPESAVFTFAKKNLKAYIKQKKRHLSVGKRYNLADKLFSASYWMSLIVQYGSLITLIWFPELIIPILSMLFIRLLTGMIIYKRAKKRLNLPLTTVMLSVLEILYIFYVVSLGTASLYSKTTKWN